MNAIERKVLSTSISLIIAMILFFVLSNLPSDKDSDENLFYDDKNDKENDKKSSEPSEEILDETSINAEKFLYKNYEETSKISKEFLDKVEDVLIKPAHRMEYEENYEGYESYENNYNYEKTSTLGILSTPEKFNFLTQATNEELNENLEEILKEVKSEAHEKNILKHIKHEKIININKTLKTFYETTKSLSEASERSTRKTQSFKEVENTDFTTLKALLHSTFEHHFETSALKVFPSSMLRFLTTKTLKDFESSTNLLQHDELNDPPSKTKSNTNEHLFGSSSRSTTFSYPKEHSLNLPYKTSASYQTTDNINQPPNVKSLIKSTLHPSNKISLKSNFYPRRSTTRKPKIISNLPFSQICFGLLETRNSVFCIVAIQIKHSKIGNYCEQRRMNPVKINDENFDDVVRLATLTFGVGHSTVLWIYGKDPEAFPLRSCQALMSKKRSEIFEVHTDYCFRENYFICEFKKY